MRADGVVVARTLGEARAVIEKLSLTNWVPVSPRRMPKNVKSSNNVLVVDGFDVPDNILRSLSVIIGSNDINLASVTLI